MTTQSIRTQIQDYVGGFLSNDGFLLSEFGSYHKSENGLKIIISFGVNTVNDVKGNFVVGYGVAIRVNRIEQIWEIYEFSLGQENARKSDTVGVGRSFFNPSSEKYSNHIFAKGGGEFVKTSEDVKQYLDVFFMEYTSTIRDTIDKITDIFWLDSHINPTIQSTPKSVQYFGNPGFWYRRVIIAKLANNPQYEEIYLWIRDRFLKGYKQKGDEKYKKIVEVLDKVHEDLKSV